MSAAISHAAIASARGDALCLGAACIVIRVASFMLIFPSSPDRHPNGRRRLCWLRGAARRSRVVE